MTTEAEKILSLPDLPLGSFAISNRNCFSGLGNAGGMHGTPWEGEIVKIL